MLRSSLDLVDIITILFPLALACAAAAVVAFRWAARSGQFDDLDTPPLRILVDDEGLESDHE